MIVVVVGLKREAALVARFGVHVTIGTPEIPAEARGVLSVGIAGALAPELAVGDTIIAERVLTANEVFESDAAWTARLAARLPEAQLGAILGRGAIADSTDVKAALRESTAADAVDMESHLAARAAKARGLPFAALRVISDGADRALPPAALVAMRPDGGIALRRVLASVLAHPSQIPALIRMGRESGAAFAALRRDLELLGPGLRGPQA